VPCGKEAVSFIPTHKLIVAGNHKLDFADQSQGMWRRIVRVRFDQTIPAERREPNLAARLRRGASGILNWVLEGYREWRQSGLQVPATVR